MYFPGISKFNVQTDLDLLQVAAVTPFVPFAPFAPFVPFAPFAPFAPFTPFILFTLLPSPPLQYSYVTVRCEDCKAALCFKNPPSFESIEADSHSYNHYQPYEPGASTFMHVPTCCYTSEDDISLEQGHRPPHATCTRT